MAVQVRDALLRELDGIEALSQAWVDRYGGTRLHARDMLTRIHRQRWVTGETYDRLVVLRRGL
jgi:hypothetical protein